MQTQSPQPVKLIVGVLAGVPESVAWAARELEARYGPVALRSPEMPFDFTTYYEAEMGTGLRRVFFAFRDLVDPGELPRIKLETNALEQEAATAFAAPGRARPINLDPGYVTLAKLVLATTKDFSHRIYLGRGIYAEITLSYREGDYQPGPLTYPDYRTAPYRAFFRDVRALLTAQLNASPGRRRPGANSR